MILLGGAVAALMAATESPTMGGFIALCDLAYGLILAFHFGRSIQARPIEQRRTEFDPFDMRPAGFFKILQARQDQITAIESLAQAVQDSLHRNAAHPLVQAISEDAHKATEDLASQAILIDHRRMDVEKFLEEQTVTEKELADLRDRLAKESNPAVREVLSKTLERKTSEFDNVHKMSESLRYLDALLEHAGATLSELKSRISLAVALSDTYIHSESESMLAETSKELQSVSETMRQTLKEI